MFPTPSEKTTHISKWFFFKFTFHFTYRALAADTVLSLSSHPPQPLKTLVVCLFVCFGNELRQLSHIFFFLDFCAPHPPPICLLPSHQMFSNGGKQVKTPQQNATRETISTCSGEITVAGNGHWKLQQQNRGVLSFSFLFTLCDSGHFELIVIKMESVTLL